MISDASFCFSLFNGTVELGPSKNPHERPVALQPPIYGPTPGLNNDISSFVAFRTPSYAPICQHHERQIHRSTPAICGKPTLSPCATSGSITVTTPSFQPIRSSDLKDPNVSACIRVSKHMEIQSWTQQVDIGSGRETAPHLHPSIPISQYVRAPNSDLNPQPWSGQQYPNLDDFMKSQPKVTRDFILSECSDFDCDECMRQKCRQEGLHVAAYSGPPSCATLIATRDRVSRPVIPESICPSLITPQSELPAISLWSCRAIDSDDATTLVGGDSPNKVCKRKAKQTLKRPKSNVNARHSNTSARPPTSRPNRRRARRA